MSKIRSVRFVITGCLALGVLMLAVPDQAAAQARWGFLAGANFANMGGDMDRIGDDLGSGLSVEKGTSTGLGLGAYYVVPASPTVSVQIEAQYVQRGVGFDFSDGTQTADTAFKLKYIELPILLRFSPAPDRTTRAVFLVGPVIGFKTGADFEASGPGGSSSVDVGEGFASPTFGALGGVGLSLQTGKTSSLLVQARYYLGLSNALDDDVYSSKAGDFGLYAGMEFALGR